MFVFVRRSHDRQPVVDLHVRIAAAQRDAQARSCAIEPFIISTAQYATHHVPGAGHFQLPLFRYAFANQHCLFSVHLVHHWEVMLATLAIAI